MTASLHSGGGNATGPCVLVPTTNHRLCCPLSSEAEAQMPMPSQTGLWAANIERMSPLERANCSDFNPYLVTPEGHLSLLVESLRQSGRQAEWPTGPAPGWARTHIDDANEVLYWRALGSDFLFGQSQPGRTPVHVGASTFRVESREDVLRALSERRAFAFCNQLFLLPDDERDFTMNSFRYHVEGKDPLPVFVGYRGQTGGHPEMLSPGLYRTRNEPTPAANEQWVRKSRILGNVLKQRFFEKHNKPLTEIEAVGIMQHHYLIGPTDLVDLTFDVNVAKWFALNEWTNDREYRAKRFVARTEQEAFREASRILVVAVRPIGSVPLTEDEWRRIHAGISPTIWEGYAETEELSQFETPPSNLAPLWSTYPRRQRGFGLRGIGPSDTDPNGAVLAAWEYLYHPNYFPDGWDRFGGPEITLDGRVFAESEDSAHLSQYLFPDPPDWLTATTKEATLIQQTQH